MECFLQYWDNLDDLYFAVAAQRERFLAAIDLFVSLIVVGTAAILGFVSAQHAPIDALAVSALLAVLLMTGCMRSRSADPA